MTDAAKPPIVGEGRREFRREFKVSEGNLRLDQFLANQSMQLTRSRLHALISEGQVRLNGSLAKPSQKVRSGDNISLVVPPPRELDLTPEPIPLAVVYQDSQLIVINKPAGLSVHPGPGHPSGTLVNALLACCPDIQGIGGALRPGIVHRLDKDTSGLMMVAKTDRAHLHLSEQIKSRLVTKGYTALASGAMKSQEGVIDAPIARDPRNRKKMAVVDGGKESRTRYRVVKQFDAGSLLEIYLESGRTHQIRVHLAHLGHPLVGDSVYGKRSPVLGRQFLHAHHLSFEHPVGGERLDFRTDLPEDLDLALSIYRDFSRQS
ncbi:MAG: RluA family pseudouridine synthase [Chloroflexi bacterium]|nr:RluA family pseudouridine synthase [Chloroflexota bacterium]MDA1219891.1 RluA family pseudouridine synthase [Chloroflexota bacterium]